MDILVVSRAKLFRDMIATCLAQGNLRVTGKFGHIGEIQSSAGDCVVLLQTAETLDGIARQAARLRRRLPRVRIVLMPPLELCTALRSAPPERVEAVVPVDRSAEMLIGTVSVVQSSSALRPERRELVSIGATAPGSVSGTDPAPCDTGAADGALRSARAEPQHKLSLRERTILQHLTRGVSNKDIARDLGIQESTVKVHLRTCYRKIGVMNRTQAALWATSHLQS